MNLWFVIGTAAELIKIYPVIEEAQRRNYHWRILQTGQSPNNFWVQANDFQIHSSRIIQLNSAKTDLKNSFMALKWFLKALFLSRRRIEAILRGKNAPLINPEDYVFIHGDTLSTLIGVLYSKRLNLRSVHIEAGMRSHCWRAPFPEEITRRIVSKLANFHMAPDHNSANNLAVEGITKGVTITGANTVVDTLKSAILASANPITPYVLANIHRFENLNSKARWNQIIEVLLEVAQTNHIIFVLMNNTSDVLERDQATKKRLLAAGIELKHRMPFKQFTQLLHGAKYVLTDGGSNQQECHYIGKPCLVLRDVTESQEGLGGSCVLSKFDPAIIRNFVENYTSFERPVSFPDKRPTDIIFESLGL